MSGVFDVVFSPEGAAEVTALALWWREHRLAAPELFQDELRRALLKVAAYPDIGARARMRGAPDVRAIVLQRTGYLVFYDVDVAASRIEVLRVRHGKRRRLTGVRRGLKRR